MNKEVKLNASFIPDEQKVKLTQHDMFDRIINLKLNCYDVATGQRESFVIRSDYELIYPDSAMPIDGTITPAYAGQCIIRRCTYKPSIKVQYKMVTSNIGTSVSIFISNFFMLTKDGKHIRSFNSSQYRMESVEIAMGYWGQFKKGDNEAPLTYDEFFQIDAKNGADKLTIVSPIIVTMEKLPPDSILHIKGYVANLYGSPVAVNNITDAKTAGLKPVMKSGDKIQDILYNAITRRYLNLHTVTGKKDTSNKIVKVSEISNFVTGVKYDEVTGLMSLSDADKYGTKFYVTDKVKELTIPKVKDSKGKEQDKVINFELGWTIGMTIARLSSFFEADLDYTFNSEGEMLIFRVDEVNDPESLYRVFAEQKAYDNSVFSDKAYYDGKLPAVYNINIDAVATIVCPFFTFLNPFQKIEFSSRYALTSIVSYFANYSATNYVFMAINASVSFATVDDVNEMQITAVTAVDERTN